MRSLALLFILTAACSSQSGSEGPSQPDATDTGTATAAATAVPVPTTTADATPTATATQAPAATASATASASAAPVETKKLTLIKKELRVDGNSIVFEPNRGVQKAKYDTYSFDKAAFEAKVGKLPLAADVEVEVEIVSSGMKSNKPSDPKLPTPMGGISIMTYECKIVSVKK
ncbi:MAG: hypothetical protein IPG04_12535 [Polyangiaceae bacterium]|jgi:hypothetical protein|nr:hypothetical protein [Polyangiaceae bacterium]